MIEVFASAKVNLCLDIFKKESSGYHQIQTIIQECLHLQNCVKIYERQQNPNKHRPKDLANSAIQLLKSRFKIEKNVELEIERNIPFSSGLGGEASNAAAVLKALNSEWGLALSLDQLEELAAELGCDVPFFIRGGTQFCTHYGELCEQLPPLQLTLKIRPLSSPLKEKTTAHYSMLSLEACGRETANTALLKALLKSTPPQEITAQKIELLLHNDFETLPEFQELEKGQHLSGAGPSTFTLRAAA